METEKRASSETNGKNVPSGILVVNKQSGMTSHDVVAICRKLFGTRKIGHAGTLDPMAEGVLVVLIGRAAKASDYVMGHDKEYAAGLRLGIETDTEDVTGSVLTKTDLIPDREKVIRVCGEFVGRIEQTPPMYSAIKVNGRKLVDLARRGLEVERKSRKVEIKSLDVVPTEDPAEYKMTVKCSKGTYVRTLCADIGKKLGCGAVMSSLVRSASGPYSIEDSITLAQLGEMAYEDRIGRLLPVETVFMELPALDMSEGEFAGFMNGIPFRTSESARDVDDGDLFRLRHKGRFIAVGRRVTEHGTGYIRQEILFETVM